MKLKLIIGGKEPGRLVCTMCGDRFKKRPALEKHLLLVHRMESTP